MATRSIIGKLFQTRNEIKLEWVIVEFSKLSEDADVCLYSQRFAFSDWCWLLKIYPNGQSENQYGGYIGLYVVKENGPSVTATCTVCLKKADGTKAHLFDMTKSFKTDKGWGCPNCIQRSDLMGRKSELLPSDILTVVCIQKIDNSCPVGVSMPERMLNLSRSLKNVLEEGKGSDVVLKLKGRELKAHRVILENRSRVFAAMLGHDMEESRTGEIAIDDIDAGVFQEVLNYMYCGRLDELTDENVRQIYTAADKYELGELKKMCTTYMEQNMSDSLFCDAFVVADTFGEEELKQIAKRYFHNNSVGILDTDEWKRFEYENESIALQLLVCIVKENGPQKKNENTPDSPVPPP